MQDRNIIVNTIIDLLGPDGTRELAEQVFDVLRADDRIYYTDANGLVLRDDVDLAAVAAELLADDDSVEVGDRVEAGEGDDYDTGRVESIDGDVAFVAWDSGVKTRANLSALTVLS